MPFKIKDSLQVGTNTVLTNTGIITDSAFNVASIGLLKRTGTNTWEIDTNNYVTSSGVTSVGATAPVVSSGGATPTISMAAATASVNGYMTSVYASKLDGIAAGAQVNVATNIDAGTVTSTTYPLTSSTGTGHTLVAATTSLAGLLTAADKTKLDDATNLNTASKLVLRDASGNFSAGTITAALTGNATTATALATGRTIGMTGDVTWTSTSFTGAGNVTGTATLANSGVTANTYNNSVTAITPITVDAKGRITATGSAVTITPAWGSITSKPTTVAGYGITDVYNKTEVDNIVTGLDFKNSVKVATTANITLSAPQTVDGVALVAGDRVLVKNQTTASENGIYVVNAGAWTRSSDADNSPTTGEVNAGMYCFVESGSTNADSGWVLVTDNPITIGTTALSFAQFNGLGQVTAGTGLTKSGSTLSLASGVVTASTYQSVTVDTYGRVTAGSNPTTLAGYSITDGVITSRTLTAGNGLTGGGDLTANRTFTLGTPGTLTTVTANDVTATSHTHAVTFPVTSVAGKTGAVALDALTISTGLSGTSYNGSAAVTIALAANYGDTLNPFASKTANTFLSAPNGAAGVPTFRTIVAADIPVLNQNTTGSSGSCTGNAATVTNGLYTTTLFGGDVSGTYNAIVVADNSHNHTSANISDATNLNTASMIVKRDASGNFSAGTITAALTGNATTATTLQTTRAINGINFNGSAAITVPVNVTNRTTDESGHLLFISTTATGNLDVYSNTGIRVNPATKVLTAEGFALDSTVYSNYATATVATISLTPVDTWAVATYRSCRYTVQITQGTDYQVSEILVIHNGTTTLMTEYAVVETNASLGTFSTDISTGTARLLVTMNSATSANIKISKTLLAI